jgi:membrane-bound ClpP family serine protease
MSSSRTSAIVLVGLAILFLVFLVGRLTIEWEWWPFLLILTGMAFVVALGLFVLRRVLR